MYFVADGRPRYGPLARRICAPGTLKFVDGAVASEECGAHLFAFAMCSSQHHEELARGWIGMAQHALDHDTTTESVWQRTRDFQRGKGLHAGQLGKGVHFLGFNVSRSTFTLCSPCLSNSS